MKTAPCDGAPIPERREDVFFVEPIRAAARFQFRVWSPAVWGVWTHFHEGTSPCYQDHNHCAEGHDPVTLRWKGYVFGWHMALNKPAYVQLSAAVIYRWWEQLGEGANMRGQLVAFGRGPKKNSRLSAEVCQYQTVEPAGLPKDLHPRASLYNLWKIPDPGWQWTKAPVAVVNLYPEVG